MKDEGIFPTSVQEGAISLLPKQYEDITRNKNYTSTSFVNIYAKILNETFVT